MMISQSERKEYIYKIKKPDKGFLFTDLHTLGRNFNQMKKGYSPIILVCGKQRGGKSFFSVWLWYRIISLFIPKVNTKIIKEHVFYDPLESLRAVDSLTKRPFLIDEAGSIFHKAEWYRRISIVFDKVLQTQAYKSNMYIFVSPFGSDIARGLRHHIDYIIHLRKRGVADVKKIPKRYDDLSDQIGRPYKIETIKLSKEAIPPKLWKEYEEFSFKRKADLRQEYMDDVSDMLKSTNKNTDPFGRTI